MLGADTKNTEDVVTMALPASEQDFVKSLMAIPYSKRASAAQRLVLVQGDKIIPLLRDLLTTKPAVHTIRVVQPTEKDVELAADGGNPNPVLVTETLRLPQTNASARYYQREVAIAMASTLAAVGNKDAIALLVSALNHPSTIGKKSLIECLVKTASDDDLLAAARTSPPAVHDSLVATLIKNKRKMLANDILGKPRKVVSSEPKVAMTTRLRRALEKVKEYERQHVWNEYTKLIDVTNQPKPDLCEEGETIKDVILTLQETLPPLHPWDEDKPENRLPKLCPVIENHLLSFFTFDTERVIQILKNTSWTSRTHRNYHSVHLPTALSEGRKARSFWCRRQDDGKVLREFWLHMMQIGDGVFVKFRNLPFASFLKLCRAPVVDELIRTALKLLETEPYQKHITVNRLEAESQLNNIMAFAVEGVINLVTRLAGCSAIKDRSEAAIYFQTSLHDLVALLFTSTVPVIRQFHTSDLEFNGKLYNGIIRPLTQAVPFPNSWSSDLTSPFKKFSPLGQQMFEQIQTIFKPKSRMEANIMSTIENILFVLAPRDTSVYALKDDKFVLPFSSIPAWDNSAVFTKCVSDSLSRAGKNPVQIDAQWVSHFNRMVTNLKDSQKDEIAQWIISSPNIKTLLNETQGNAILPLLDTIFTNIDLRHQFVFPLVFVDKKEKEVDLADNIADWAAYVDIRIPSVRALLVKETTKPSFEDRLKWIRAILKATQLSRRVQEWILTLKWLVPKIRNEIHPNLTQLAPFLRADYPWVPRQYLDDATLEQAVELEALYLKMDSQNASAITPVAGIADFVDAVANEALKRYIASPDHPFFRLGHEIPWRRQLTSRGEKGALEYYNLNVSTPNYSDKDRHEETEVARRKELKRNEDECETHGMGRGTANIPEGMEEEIVKAELNVFYTHWLSVKDTLDPDVEAADIEAFKKAQSVVWQSACQALHYQLGWRWTKSPTLVSYMEEVLDQLAAAPTKTFGPDKILDWKTDIKLASSARHVQNIFLKYTDKWMAKNRHSLPSYTRFRDLRLTSTLATTEADERLEKSVLESGKRDTARFEAEVLQLIKMSPSAISLSRVRDYLSLERPDLLQDEHLSMTEYPIGMFNQVETAQPTNFFINKSSRLIPHQCEILKARHLLGMKDPGTPFATRVLHAEHFVAIPNTTVEDIADALATPSLPSRVTEALLMYLPTLAEPGVTLPLLLAPVYIQSHMARTAIHAVENALKHVSLNDVPEYILPLFPPAGGRQQKVTVQKEGVRLACANMALFADSKIRGLFKDLWGRADLNVDVRSVILQSLLNLLFSSAAKEARHKDEVAWIWQVLAETAHSNVHKTSGAAFVLLAAVPATQAKSDAPNVVAPGIWRVAFDNATLNNLAVIKVPEVYVNRYVDEILIPLASELTDKDDENLVEVRNLALQSLIVNEEWITPKNAVKLAKEWKAEAFKLALDDDPKLLWGLYVAGVRKCVGKEVAGAVDEESMVAWRELIGLIEDLASHFLDKNLTRTLRLKALARIQSLGLGTNFMLQYFDKVKPTIFHGKDSDLMEPLMGKAFEPVMWKTALEREINVFKPQKPMTQFEINDGSLKILLRIAHFSNRYVSDSGSVLQWLQKLETRASGNVGLKRHLGEALLAPHDELVDWVHLNEATLATLKNNNHGMFKLDEISGFVERVASQDSATFYWTNQSTLAYLLSVEMNRHKVESGEQNLGPKRIEAIEFALKPILSRAQAEAWIRGADAMIIRNLSTSSAMEAFYSAFPQLIGPILHSYIANSALNVVQDASVTSQLVNIVNTPGLIMAKCSRKPVHNPRPNARIGLSPLTVIVMDAFLDGRLEGLDLTNALATHQIADDVLYGEMYPFRRGTGKFTDFQGHDNPRTMQQVKKRWANLIDTHSHVYKTVEQSINRASKTLSPMVVHAYRTHSIALLNNRPKYIAFRPLEYLEYVRINLTAPGTTLTIEAVAQQIASAFTPEDISSDKSSFGWAPPLSLALDVIEHLMNEIRPEVEIEGQREVQIIELLAATTLQKWVRVTVETPCGKLLAEHEGVKELEARYLALVEELCQYGSGGQSVALQLGDFVPGGVQTAA